MADYSNMSDAELMAQVSGSGSPQPASSSTDYKSMSNEELLKTVSGSESAAPQSQAPQGLAGDAQETQNKTDQPSPINMGQHALVSLPYRLDSKLHMLNSMKTKTGQPIQATADSNGHILINGIPMSPTPTGFTNFFKHLDAYIGDMAGPSLSMAGQIAGEAGATALAVGTDGAALPSLMAGGAAGSGAGELARQGLANAAMSSAGLPGEGANAGEAALQAGIGGAVPAVDQFVVKPILNVTSATVKAISNKLGKGVLPNVLDQLGDLPIGQGQRLQQLIQDGNDRALDQILNPKSNLADPTVGESIASRPLFKGASQNADGMVKKLEQELVGADPIQAQIKSKFFQEYFPGLSDNTIQAIAKGNAERLLNPDLLKADVSMQEAQAFGAARASYLKGLQNEYENVAAPLVKNTTDRFSIKDEAGSFVQSVLNDPSKLGGIPILSKMPNVPGMYAIDSNYKNPTMLSAVKSILNRFGEVRNVSGRPTYITLTDQERLRFGKLNINNMSAGELFSLKKSLAPLFEKTLGGASLSSSEARPFAELDNVIRTKLADKYDALKNVNAKYSEFYKQDSVFPEYNPRELDSVRTLSNKLSSMASSPQDAKLLSDYSNLIGKKNGGNILDKMKDIHAANEIAQLDQKGVISNAPIRLLKDLKTINNADDVSDSLRKRLEFYDNALKPNSKFVEDARNHVLASNLNNPRSLFAIKRIAFVTGLAGMAYHNPLASAPLLGGLGFVSNPRNIARAANAAARGQRFLANSLGGKAVSPGLKALGMLTRQAAERGAVKKVTGA